MPTLEELKYPIGTFKIPEDLTQDHISQWIHTIQEFPVKVKEEVISLQEEALLYRYRPEGWNIQQVVNHCIDSHMNSVIRFKLALTEDCPTIRPYQEDKWALLSDTLTYPIQDSLELLEQVHKRWVHLLKGITKDQWECSFIHPEGNENIQLKENLCIYAWHCEHHLQHIKNAKAYRY